LELKAQPAIPSIHYGGSENVVVLCPAETTTSVRVASEELISKK
jgi:hypothetical protein